MNTSGCPSQRPTSAVLVVLVAAAALLGACQSSEPVGLSQESTDSPPVPLDPTPSATVTHRSSLTPIVDGRCVTMNLRVRVGGRANSDVQGTHVPLQFTNTGPTSCTLIGAPGVSYVMAENGGEVGEPATRRTDGPKVTLAQGETASAGLFLSSAPLKTPDCERVSVPGLKVYPPGNTEAAFVERASTACRPPVVGPFLRVGPVEPGADNTAS
jgi:hypothetical protein